MKKLLLLAAPLLLAQTDPEVRVLVQRSDGTDVSLDDCAALSGPLGEALEAAALLDATPTVLLGVLRRGAPLADLVIRSPGAGGAAGGACSSASLR